MSGKCSRCPYRWKILKDGTVASHWLYGHRPYPDGSWGQQKFKCEGSRLPPNPPLPLS